MQWAALNTHSGLIRLPPHRNSPCGKVIKTSAWCGNWLVRAICPLTIFGLTFDRFGGVSSLVTTFLNCSCACVSVKITSSKNTFIVSTFNQELITDYSWQRQRFLFYTRENRTFLNVEGRKSVDRAKKNLITFHDFSFQAKFLFYLLRIMLRKLSKLPLNKL